MFAGIKPGAVPAGVTGPTSQIPGLSQSADVTAPVERTSGRRVGIFETDSDYVKLAKSGGHKGERRPGGSEGQRVWRVGRVWRAGSVQL